MLYPDGVALANRPASPPPPQWYLTCVSPVRIPLFASQTSCIRTACICTLTAWPLRREPSGISTAASALGPMSHFENLEVAKATSQFENLGKAEGQRG